MKKRWSIGHIGRFWDQTGFKQLPYVKQPLMESEIQEWRSRGYDYVKSFSGSIYDNRNPMPEWVERFRTIFSLKNMTFSFYRMQQLEIMPEHSDHYQTYIKLHGAEYKNIRRIVIMLEDWRPGHYLEIDGVGFTNWIAGDYFIWENDVKHAAANIGVDDRYSLQITGEIQDYNNAFKSVHWYNIPGLPSKAESFSTAQLELINNRLEKTTPYMIYLLNQELQELQSIQHSDADRLALNSTGLEIYLYEPLCSYMKGQKIHHPPHGTKYSLGFYNEFRNDYISDGFDLRSSELDSIERYIDRNKLTKVAVHTCDYDVEKYYRYYESKMRVDCHDLFLAHFDGNEFEPLSTSDRCDIFDKKFISLNWRYTPHRQLIAAFLAGLVEEDTASAYITWYFKADFGHISTEPWYDLNSWNSSNPEMFAKLLRGLNKLNGDSPWTIDLQHKQPTVISHSYFKECYPIKLNDEVKIQSLLNDMTVLKNTYLRAFCDVVTESRFAQPTANYSEKTYRPMFYKKPFIMVGPPHTLKYMKEHGFKTFDEFWDESYDTCIDHEKRIFSIFALIEKLNAMSFEELAVMYTNMERVLEHNRTLLLKKLVYSHKKEQGFKRTLLT